MKKGERKQERIRTPLTGTMIGILRGGGFAAVFLLLFLLLCSALLASGILKEQWCQIVALCGCVLAGLLGGMYAAAGQTGNALLKGAGVGAVLFLLINIFGTLYLNAEPAEGVDLSVLLAGTGGGILSAFVMRKPSKRNKRR